jgi:DNA-binding transcriptional regulator LsrR (DeoR family)
MTCQAKPIEFRGVVYPSQAALASALGLSSATVSLAVRKGRLETLGRGKKAGCENGGTTKRANEQRRQPVASMGYSWVSQRDCARALGVSDDTVCKALAKGRIDNLVARCLSHREAAE